MAKDAGKHNPPSGLRPVCYIYGSEDYLAQETLNEIRSAAFGEFESMNYHVFDGKSAEPSEVIAVAVTIPAFSKMRVVVVKNAESIKAVHENEYYEYVKNPSPSTCLVFMSGAAKIDTASEFFRYMREKNYLKACRRLSEAEILGWLKKEAGKQGKEITVAAAQKLLQIAGDRLRDIKGELDKIILFVGDKPMVDDSDVEDAGLDCREETIFDLSEAIGNKDVKRAIKVFGKISGEEPLKVLGAISRQMRTLLKLKASVKKGITGARLAGALKVPPFHLDGYLKRSRSFTQEELIKAIYTLKTADNDLKTGRFPEEFVISKLILDLCGART